MKRKIMVGIILLCLAAFMSKSVFALSFGSYVKNDRINIDSGEEVAFTIVLYSGDETDVSFDLDILYSPDGLEMAYPKHIDSSYEKTEYVLKNGNYQKSYVVDVMVRALPNTTIGSDEIFLKVAARNEGGGGNSMSVKAEKTFRFLINDGVEQETSLNIESSRIGTNQKPESISSGNQESELDITGLVTTESNRYYFWMLIIPVIALISYFVYRKSFNLRDTDEKEIQ